MKIKEMHQDIWIGLIIIVLCGVLFGVNSNLNTNAGMMPRLLLAAMGVMGILIVAGGMKKTKTNNTEDGKLITLRSMKVPFSAYLYIVVYIVLFRLTGYFIATPIFLLGLMRHFKIKNWKIPIIVSVVYISVIYLIFVRKLNVSVDNLGLLGKFIGIN